MLQCKLALYHNFVFSFINGIGVAPSRMFGVWWSLRLSSGGVVTILLRRLNVLGNLPSPSHLVRPQEIISDEDINRRCGVGHHNACLQDASQFASYLN